MNKKIKIIELLNKIANGEKVPKIIKYNYDTFQYSSKWEQYIKEGYDEIPLLRIISDYNYSGLNDEVEILEDNTEEIEELNAYKLMESPYMANLLKEQRYDKFMELLKQSEVEIADKLIKLTWVVKEMRKEITNVNKNNIH